MAPCKPVNYTALTSNTAFWGWDGWFVLVDIFLLFTVLFFNIAPVEFAMLAAVGILMAAQIITIPDGVAGFSNTGILAVLCLFVVAEALSSTGAIDYFVGRFLGKPKTLGGALIRLFLPSAFVASWISSTAVLAIMIPVVSRWAKQINRPPSQLFMPLCYAIHLGGTVTLVGTTTNLVVSGLATSQMCRTMGIFELTQVGLPVAIAGLGALLILTPITMPNAQEYERRTHIDMASTADLSIHHKIPWYTKILMCLKLRSSTGPVSASNNNNNINNNNNTAESDPLVIINQGHKEDYTGQDRFRASPSDFFLFAKVVGSPVAKQSIEQAGLRGLKTIFLVSVQRQQTLYSAVSPEFVLEENDILTFTGAAMEDFVELCRSKGLETVSLDQSGSTSSAAASTTPNSNNNNPVSDYIVQAIVRDGSKLVGKTPKEVDFRSTYNAVIISIQRLGKATSKEKVLERVVADRLGQVTLKVGDILALVTNPNFNWNAEATNRDLKPKYDERIVLKTLPSTASLTSSATKDDVSVGSLDTLPAAATTTTTGDENKNNYLFAMRVKKGAQLIGVRSLIGLTIEQAGVRHIFGVRLVAIEQALTKTIIRAPGPDIILQENDILWYAGEKEGLAALRRLPGLEDLMADQVNKLNIEMHKRALVEVVLSMNSSLLYKTVRESQFRTRFQAAIMSVQRRGNRLFSHIGDLVLEPGDVLILDAGSDFIKRNANKSEDFLIISEVKSSSPPRFDRFWFALIVSIAMVVVAATTGVDLVLPTLIAAALMVIFKVITPQKALAAVDWRIYITIASAYGLSSALTNTRVGVVIGTAITDFAVRNNFGELGVLAVIMIFTEILCALITAKAGAVLMFPIAASAAARLKIDPTRMLIALMLGSSDYTTPQGHQTNLMVLGPGAYKFTDYQKLGIPLEIFLNIWQLICLNWINDWGITTGFSIMFFFACIVFDHVVKERQSIGTLFSFCSDSPSSRSSGLMAIRSIAAAGRFRRKAGSDDLEASQPNQDPTNNNNNDVVEVNVHE
jgi:di/tricarboxylate transporter